MHPMDERVGQLELRVRGTGWKHYLLERPLSGGDVIELCMSGGWITGHYEWAGDAQPARFHFTVELGDDRVWESSFALPDGALVRWAAT